MQDFKEIETKVENIWKENKVYKYIEDNTKKIFSIDTPPPTVSGKMHIGHAYSYVLPDFIARFKRKMGYNVFYPFGLDDNGIATELLVEKLAKIRAKDLEKSKFIELCLKHTKEAEEELHSDFNKLGLSCDWNLLYRTISPEVVRVAQYSFLDLYSKGKIYRKKGPILFCTKCQTAISQAELVDLEKSTYFNDLIFKLEDGKEIIIATTRPEFLPACVAIFVNPEDNRYKNLIGKNAIVPLFNQKVKILADNKVDINKGSGIVMCCTFGDQTDMEWYKAYNLDLKEAITNNGLMTDICGKYAGLKIEDARKEIIEDLKKENLLKDQKQINHAVNCHERCLSPVEILVNDQWYIDYLKDKEFFIEEANKISWIPKHMKIRYDNWVKNLQWDWCISRDRFYGVPFPVWYCKSCNKPIFADIKDLPIYPEESYPKNKCDCGSNEFIADKSIMDTWSTSALTPLINMGWPDKDVSNVIPMSMRPQGQDIITLWAFNTIVKTLYHLGKLPWNTLMINGYVVDSKGDKMSKSKGNIIAPQELLDKFGKDAFRYWCAQVTLGDDISYSEKEMLTARKLIIKLENSMNFVNLAIKDFETIPEIKSENFIDTWILEKLYSINKLNIEDLEKMDYSHAIQRIRDFFYFDFCDNYLEFIKYRFYNGSDKEKQELASTIFKVSLEILNQFNIFLPFTTEEIYQNIFKKYVKENTLINLNWTENKAVNETILSKGENFKEVITLIRKYKSENNLSMKAEIENISLKVKYPIEDDERKEIEKILFVKNITYIIDKEYSLN